MRFILLVFLLFGGIASVQAQPTPRLHVSVLELESFVAVGGEKSGAAGLYRQQGDTTWTHLGWGNTRNFGVDAVPGDPGSLFLACGNGVLRTLDNSASWKITTGWEMTEVLDVVVDPNAPTHVYAATAYGVWHSPDLGETWTEVNTGIPAPTSTYTQAIVADRRHAGHLVVGSEEGLYRTTNGGAKWIPVGPRDVAIRDLTQSEANSSLWLAGTEEDGVLVSRDGGASWSFVEDALEEKTIHAVAADPAEADRLAVGGFESGVYVSDDGGQSWRLTGLTDRRVHALVFDVRHAGRLWAGTLGDGIFSRERGERDWQHAGLDGAVIRDLDFFEAPATEEARSAND